MSLMTASVIIIKSHEVLCDIRSAAWLESELHESLPLHRRHEMADVCEEGNIEKIWRVLGLCDTEVRVALRRILVAVPRLSPVNSIESPEEWEYHLAECLRTESVNLTKEKIHDYFVASAMADRAEVIIPECAPIWRERAAGALTAISECAASAMAGVPVRRRMCPF